MGTGGFWTIVMLLAGCAYERTTLVPPPELAAPLEERLAAWERLKPVGADESRLVREGGFGSPRATLGTQLEFVELGGGQRVEDPRDLAAMLRPGTRTEVEAEAWASADQAWHWWAGAAGMSFAAGLVLMLTDNRYAFYSGIGLLLGGPVLSIILGAILTGSSERHRVAAFSSYTDDLLDALGLVHAAHTPR